MVSISRFKVLLNNLSSELDQRNLQSLVHVCGDLIPGGQRERISTGWDVFNILLQHNAIGEEPQQMKFLLGIIKELRPKRRDLVSMVKTHIENNYDEPETILHDFESSSDGYLIIPRPPTPVPVSDCCSVHCGCFNCNCTPCCDGSCCCVILGILLIFLAVVAVLFWHTKIFPSVGKYLESKDDLKDAGPAVIGVLGFIALCCVACGGYMKRRNRLLAYAELRSNMGETRSIYTPSELSCSAHATKIDRPGRNGHEYSCSSGHITATNSYSSMCSFRTPWSMPEPVVTDGCMLQDDEENHDDDELVQA